MQSEAKSPTPKVATTEVNGDGSALKELLSSLITDRLVYFPIRHHSPACARHLEAVIRRWKPQAILIEGPASFSSLIPLVLHAKTKAPFAIYTSFVGEEPETESSTTKTAALLGPPRHAAYYPFCDYSPELVALRVGAEVAASLRFVDLDYPDQIRAEREASKEDGAPRVESLLAERHFKRSRYLQTLARRVGCRDHNDLWDHLFETRLKNDGLDHSAVEQFIRDVAAWCHFARADATAEELEADGTLARESAMSAAVQDHVCGSSGRTGKRNSAHNRCDRGISHGRLATIGCRKEIRVESQSNSPERGHVGLPHSL
jgi:hypothetical protein